MNRWFRNINEEFSKAIEDHDLQKVCVCIVEGADVNKLIRDRKTPMYYYNHPNEIWFIYPGVYRHLMLTKMTPLMLAAKYGYTDMIILLLKNGARINDFYGLTPLMMAVQYGHTEAVSTLIKYGAKVNMTSHEIDSAFRIAICYHHTQIAEILLEAGATVKNRYNNEFAPTLLMEVAERGWVDMVKFLLRRGIAGDINLSNSKGNTALMEAASEGHTDVVKILFNNGANLEIKNSDGKTAEILAARHSETRDVIRKTQIKWARQHGLFSASNSMGQDSAVRNNNKQSFFSDCLRV